MAPPVHEAPPSLVSPFHPFRSTPAPLFLVGWLGKRDATHLLPNYFAHGSVKNFPRCHYCSVARENLVICSFHCSSSFSLFFSFFLSRAASLRKMQRHLVSARSQRQDDNDGDKISMGSLPPWRGGGRPFVKQVSLITKLPHENHVRLSRISARDERFIDHSASCDAVARDNIVEAGHAHDTNEETRWVLGLGIRFTDANVMISRHHFVRIDAGIAGWDANDSWDPFYNYARACACMNGWALQITI